jgi:uncharacterized protein
MGWFGGKENDFFGLLNEQANNLQLAANKLRELIDNYNKFDRNERKTFVMSIKSVKIKTDEIVRSIIGKTDKNSNTPYHKEDIKRLGILLDDSVALIYKCASRLSLLGIERINDHISKFAEAAAKLAVEIRDMISDLNKINNAGEHCPKIYGLEIEVNELFDEALSEVFHFYKNPIDVMRYREIYEIILAMAGKCRNIANTIESIALKNS